MANPSPFAILNQGTPLLARPQESRSPSLGISRLLEEAQISPVHLNTVMETRIRRRRGPMRYDDAIPRRLMKASGVEIDLLRRRNGTFLFEINDRRFIYRERGVRDCFVIIPMSTPDTVKYAAVGEIIEKHVALAGPALILRGSLILAAIDSWEGSVAFALRPVWMKSPPAP